MRRRNHLRQQGRGFKLLRPSENPQDFGATPSGYYKWRYEYRGIEANLTFEHTSGVWTVRSDQPKVKAIGPHGWGWFPPDAKLADLFGEIKAAVDRLLVEDPRKGDGQPSAQPHRPGTGKPAPNSDEAAAPSRYGEASLHDLARHLFESRQDWQPGDETTVWQAPTEPIRFYLKCSVGYVTLLCSYRGRDLPYGHTVGVLEDEDWRLFLLSEAGYPAWREQVKTWLKAERRQCRGQQRSSHDDGEALWVREPEVAYVAA